MVRALAVLLVTSSLLAQSSPPPIDPALRARFGFVGPRIHKVGVGIGMLRCADMDGAAGMEVVVHDARRGRLEVLGLKDGQLKAVETIDCGGAIRGMEVGDVDGDGVRDLVMYRDDGRVEVRLRGDEARRLTLEVGPPGGGNALRMADLDTDGKPDAVVWTRDGLRVLTGLGTKPAAGPTIAIGSSATQSLQVFDADGDERADIVLRVGDNTAPLRIRRGDGRGGFGPWLLFRLPNLVRVAPFADDRGTSLVAIQDRRLRIVGYRLAEAASARASTALLGVPDLKRGAFPFAQGDVDGDGDADLVLAHPERAELYYLIENGGRFTSRAVPAPAGISSIALGDVDGDGRADLVLASPEERLLAWKRGGDPLEKFPSRIACDNVPSTVGVGPAGQLLYVSRDERKRNAVLMQTQFSEGAFADAVKRADLDRLSGDPLRLHVGDFNGDDQIDVAFVPGDDELRVVRGGQSSATEKESAAAGLPQKVADGAVSVTASRDALLVVAPRFARRMRLVDDGRAEVLGQQNAPTGSEQLALGCDLGDAVVLADKRAGRLFRVASDGRVQSVQMPLTDATHVIEHAGDPLVITRGGVFRVKFGPGWTLEPQRTHEPPTDDTRYHEIVAADLDGDQTLDLAALDDDIHGVQVMVAQDAGFARALAFPSLELPDGSGYEWEPRTMVVGDINADGRDDLVLIAVDRILVYLQDV